MFPLVNKILGHTKCSNRQPPRTLENRYPQQPRVRLRQTQRFRGMDLHGVVTQIRGDILSAYMSCHFVFSCVLPGWFSRSRPAECRTEVSVDFYLVAQPISTILLLAHNPLPLFYFLFFNFYFYF